MMEQGIGTQTGSSPNCWNGFCAYSSSSFSVAHTFNMFSKRKFQSAAVPMLKQPTFSKNSRLLRSHAICK